LLICIIASQHEATGKRTPPSEDRVHVELSSKEESFVQKATARSFSLRNVSHLLYIWKVASKGLPLHKCHPAIVHIYTKAQSRATEVGSSIGHHKLQTVPQQAPVHPNNVDFGAAAAAMMMIVACETK
jgi:hypothetical protein